MKDSMKISRASRIIGPLIGIAVGMSICTFVEDWRILFAIGVFFAVSYFAIDPIGRWTMRFFVCRKYGITQERLDEIREEFKRSHLG